MYLYTKLIKREVINKNVVICNKITSYDKVFSHTIRNNSRKILVNFFIKFLSDKRLATA